MPEPYRPNRAYPGKTWTLGHAAEAGQLVEVYCTHCRRLTRFLAADFVTLLDPGRDALLPPFQCSKCMKPDTSPSASTSPPPATTGIWSCAARRESCGCRSGGV